MSYLKAYLEGQLPIYNPPKGAFTPRGNGVGVVHAVGRDVWHLKPGQRVVLSSHFTAAENVEDPAQILIGVTAFGPDAERVQADWRDGTLADKIRDSSSVACTQPIHSPQCCPSSSAVA